MISSWYVLNLSDHFIAAALNTKHQLLGIVAKKVPNPLWSDRTELKDAVITKFAVE